QFIFKRNHLFCDAFPIWKTIQIRIGANYFNPLSIIPKPCAFPYKWKFDGFIFYSGKNLICISKTTKVRCRDIVVLIEQFLLGLILNFFQGSGGGIYFFTLFLECL